MTYGGEACVRMKVAGRKNWGLKWEGILKKAIQKEADEVIRNHGEAASREIQGAINSARRRRNARLESYLVKLAQEIERRAVSDKDRYPGGLETVAASHG